MCWMIKEREGEHDLECEQLTFPDSALPMLVPEIRNGRITRLSCRLWLLTRQNRAGLAFRYTDSRHFYFFALAEGRKAILYKKCEDATEVSI